MSFQLALDDRAVLGLDELEQLYQGVIFYADRIAIRAGAAITTGPARGHIERKLAELRELGVLFSWAHEYEVGANGNVTGLNRGTSVPDLVVDAETVRRIVGEVDESIGEDRRPAYAEALGDRQGILEIARLRRQLTVVSVTSELGLDGLLSQSGWLRALDSGTTIAGGGGATEGKVQTEVTRAVIDRCRFGPLSGLDSQTVEACRRHASAFRELVVRTAGGELILRDTADPGRIAESVFQQYQELLNEYGRPRLPKEIGDEVAWDALGVALPPTIALKYGFKAFKWRREKKDFEPFLLLSDIQRGLYRASKVPSAQRKR